MNKLDLLKVAREVLEQMPPETRFRPEDGEVIARHRETLLSWTPELVQAFYDTLFAHPPTKAVFREGERPEREKTLEGWWRRTVEGPLDEEYFAWMAKVGVVHVLRGVRDPMMLSMLGFVVRFVERKAHAAGLPDADRLREAFYRLSMAIGGAIAEGFLYTWTVALKEVAGMEPALLERLTVEEARSMLEDLR